MEPKKYHNIDNRTCEAKTLIIPALGATYWASKIVDLYYTNNYGERVYGLPGLAAPAVAPGAPVEPAVSRREFVDLMARFWAGRLSYILGKNRWAYKCSDGEWKIDSRSWGGWLGEDAVGVDRFVFSAVYAVIESRVLASWEAEYKRLIDSGSDESAAWYDSVACISTACGPWKDSFRHMVAREGDGRWAVGLSRHKEIVSSPYDWRAEWHRDRTAYQLVTYIGPN
jgi:hypothetical protein